MIRDMRSNRELTKHFMTLHWLARLHLTISSTVSLYKSEDGNGGEDPITLHPLRKGRFSCVSVSIMFGNNNIRIVL